MNNGVPDGQPPLSLIPVSMKLINTAEAAGYILCHDMTEVVPGKSKVTRFRRGQLITAADIPVLFVPGVMLLLSYYEKKGLSIPVIGAPACVFYEHLTALDILLPRLMADDPVSREDLARLGEGGMQK